MLLLQSILILTAFVKSLGDERDGNGFFMERSFLSAGHNHDIHFALRNEEIRRRGLQSCSDLMPALQTVLNTLYGASNIECSCNSDGSSSYSCSSDGEICCEGNCFLFTDSGTFEDNFSSLTPLTEDVCFKYTNGTAFSGLIGSTRCVNSTYCSDGATVCSCTTSIDNEQCDSCTVCDSFAWAPGVQLAVQNCSNIPAAQNISFQCSQIDTPAELEAISRQLDLGTCSSASTMTTDALVMVGAAVFGVLVSKFAISF